MNLQVGFMDCGLGFRVKVKGLGFTVWLEGVGFGVEASYFRVFGFRVLDLCVLKFCYSFR